MGYVSQTDSRFKTQSICTLTLTLTPTSHPHPSLARGAQDRRARRRDSRIRKDTPTQSQPRDTPASQQATIHADLRNPSARLAQEDAWKCLTCAALHLACCYLHRRRSRDGGPTGAWWWVGGVIRACTLLAVSVYPISWCILSVCGGGGGGGAIIMVSWARRSWGSGGASDWGTGLLCMAAGCCMDE